MAAIKTNLPALKELHYDVAEAFKHDQLKLLLNQPPHDTFIKKHPMTKNAYLPIDKVEFMLDRIFQQWKVEVKDVGTMFNSIYCVVRIHYLNPITGEWSYHDGVGAKSAQLDSGALASDMSKIKPDAIAMALPTAKSQAIKDACDHLGKLFGRDLNRKDTLGFAGAYNEEKTDPTPPSTSNNNYETSENDLPL